MTVKELEMTLAELRAAGKIDDDSRVLGFKAGEYEEDQTVKLLTDIYDPNELCNDMQHYIDRCNNYEVKWRKVLLDKLETDWRKAVVIN